MMKRFSDLEPGALFATREGGHYQKLPPVRPDGFMWLFANTISTDTRRFAFFGDHVWVKQTGHEPLNIQAGRLHLETSEGWVALEFGTEGDSS